MAAIANYFDTPGPMRMNGYQALWYARSRAADDDYNRMSRQRCVVQAVVGQVSATAMLAKYADIARIARENIYTDIPAANLAAFVELVERIQKSGKFVSVGIDPSHGINPGNPDYEQIRALVTKAITPPEPKPTARAPSRARPSRPPPHAHIKHPRQLRARRRRLPSVDPCA